MLTCPWCVAVEPNEMLLRNNHWIKPSDEPGYDWCADHGMCIAMNLAQNHVYAYARMLRGDWRSDFPTCECHRRYNADCGRVALARAIARAEEVWPTERAGWLDEYRPLTQPLDAPEPHAVAASEEVALW